MPCVFGLGGVVLKGAREALSLKRFFFVFRFLNVMMGSQWVNCIGSLCSHLKSLYGQTAWHACTSSFKGIPFNLSLTGSTGRMRRKDMNADMLDL